MKTVIKTYSTYNVYHDGHYSDFHSSHKFISHELISYGEQTAMFTADLRERRQIIHSKTVILSEQM